MSHLNEHMSFRVFSVFRGFRPVCVLPAFFAIISSAVGGPKIEFAEPKFDFGKVPAGEIIKHAFAFTNTGDQTLEIKDVRPSCGCTTAGHRLGARTGSPS